MQKLIFVLKLPVKAFLFPFRKIRSLLSANFTSHYFVSFPKSGRTWVRVFIAKYLEQAFAIPFTFNLAPILKHRSVIPRIGFAHHGMDARDTSELSGEIAKLTGRHVIFLVRDPRDVIVSYYFQHITRDVKYDKDIDQSISLKKFIRHPEHGIKKIIAFMNTWYAHKDIFSDFLLVRYEDCRKDTETCFKNILCFLALVPINQEAFQEAVTYSSFNNMKKLEQKDALGNDILRPGDASNPDSYKVRKGKIGGYTEYMDEEDIAYVNNVMKDLSPEFGYAAID